MPKCLSTYGNPNRHLYPGIHMNRDNSSIQDKFLFVNALDTLFIPVCLRFFWNRGHNLTLGSDCTLHLGVEREYLVRLWIHGDSSINPLNVPSQLIDLSLATSPRFTIDIIHLSYWSARGPAWSCTTWTEGNPGILGSHRYLVNRTQSRSPRLIPRNPISKTDCRRPHRLNSFSLRWSTDSRWILNEVWSLKATGHLLTQTPAAEIVEDGWVDISDEYVTIDVDANQTRMKKLTTKFPRSMVRSHIQNVCDYIPTQETLLSLSDTRIHFLSAMLQSINSSMPATKLHNSH